MVISVPRPFHNPWHLPTVNAQRPSLEAKPGSRDEYPSEAQSITDASLPSAAHVWSSTEAKSTYIFSDGNMDSSATGISSIDVDLIEEKLNTSIAVDEVTAPFVFRGSPDPSTPVPTRRCIVCQEEADLACDGCRNTPGHENASYCSAECQKADWTKHMPQCKLLEAKRGLFRAGDLIQALWYAHRELSFDKNLVKLENKGHRIYLHEGGGDKKPFYKFPGEICQTSSEKHAVLSFQGSMEAVAAFQPFIVKLLKNIVTHVEEVSVIPTDYRGLDIVTIDSEGTEHRDMETTLHEVWKVITVGSETYYIDLTGAQYGFSKTIIPETEFEQLHAERILYYENRKLGRNQLQLDELYTGVNDIQSSEFKPKLCECISYAINQWERRSAVTASRLLLMSDNGFSRKGFRFNREWFRIAIEEAFRIGSDLSKGAMTMGDFDIEVEGSGEEARLKFVDKSAATGMSGEDSPPDQTCG